jgi:hypothetical protein
VNPFGTRGLAEEFAGLLRDRDAGARLAVSSLAGPLAGSVALAERLQLVGRELELAVAPRPEFRAALRTRLVAVATVQAQTATAPVQRDAATGRRRQASAGRSGLEALGSRLPAWRAPRATGLAAAALASVVAVSGVAVAGQQSLPGDPFYGVKRTTEAIQLRLTDGEVERGTRHLDFAATRLREVRALALGRDALPAPALSAQQGSPALVLQSAAQPLAAEAGRTARADGLLAERITDTLAAMDDETRKGSSLLTEASRRARTTEPLRVLVRFADRQVTGLEQLLPALPADSRDRGRASLALVTEVAEQTEQLLGIGTCGTACDPSEAAPTLPADVPSTGPSPAVPSEPTGAGESCLCAPNAEPAPPRDRDAPGAQPTGDAPAEPAPRSSPPATRSPSPRPATPAPSPSSGLPLPVPVPSLPVPVPSLPVPTLTPPALAPAVPGTTVPLPALSPTALSATALSPTALSPTALSATALSATAGPDPVPGVGTARLQPLSRHRLPASTPSTGTSTRGGPQP